MQTLILACYLCLQLTSISDLSESLILKRDTSCDECLSGLFNDNEILSGFKFPGKTSGEILSSYKMLRDLVQQRLTKYESSAEPPQKAKEVSESEKRVILERFLAEEKQKAAEAKANQKKRTEDVEKELAQMKRQILEEQAQQNRKYEEYAKKLRESIKKYEIPTMEDTTSFKHILRNEVRIMAGQYLLSENGRYKATMQSSCFLVITDELRDGNVVKKVGTKTYYGSSQCHMIMQDDGNLVIYHRINNGKGEQVGWATSTNSRRGAGYYVKLENDGELAMYNQDHRRIWSDADGKLYSHGYDL